MHCVSEIWTLESRDLCEEDFLQALPGKPFAFLYGQGRYLIMAEDPLCEVEAPRLQGFLFERSGPLPPILPDFIGHACYEFGYGLDPVLEPLQFASPGPVPMFLLTLFRKIRIYDKLAKQLFLGRRQAERQLGYGGHLLGQGPFRASKLQDSDGEASYCRKVERIREAIRSGDVYQVNLTRQESWSYRGDLGQFARRLLELNPAPYSALLADPRWTVISSSPECFFRIDQGRILTRPIKGTAPRHPDRAQDEAARHWLLSSEKNQSELAMIVDLLRNDLTRACRVPSVKVDAFPVLESFANVHHLVADVSGQLKEGITLEQIFKAVFPGGSITGCPKLAAMDLIRALESRPRCIYTGALGWCRSDVGQAEFAIPIRTAWAVGDTLSFGVGGGVVWDSEPREEYEETVHKGRSLVSCLNSA